MGIGWPSIPGWVYASTRDLDGRFRCTVAEGALPGSSGSLWLFANVKCEGGITQVVSIGVVFDRKYVWSATQNIAVVHALSFGGLKELHQVADEMDQSVRGHSNDKIMHAVIVPFAAAGHVTPALQLARKLVTLGFRITIVNTTHIHDRMMKSQALAMQSE